MIFFETRKHIGKDQIEITKHVIGNTTPENLILAIELKYEHTKKMEHHQTILFVDENQMLYEHEWTINNAKTYEDKIEVAKSIIDGSFKLW